MSLTINKKRIFKALEDLPEDATIGQAMFKLYELDQTSKAEQSPYDPEFVAKILESKKQAREGRVTAIKTEDLWK